MQVCQVFDLITKIRSLSASVIDKKGPYTFFREACLGDFFSHESRFDIFLIRVFKIILAFHVHVKKTFLCKHEL